MNLTREETIKLHRALWRWLSENPMKQKRDWPGWELFPDIPCNCFLCVYTGRGAYPNCSICPVEFKANEHIKGTIGYCLGGLYAEWDLAKLPEERSRIAALIRDLPERKHINRCPEDKVEVIQTIVLQFQKAETTCVIESKKLGTFIGKAKCHPDDKWDENIGKKLAFGRAVQKFAEFQPEGY